MEKLSSDIECSGVTLKCCKFHTCANTEMIELEKVSFSEYLIKIGFIIPINQQETVKNNAVDRPLKLENKKESATITSQDKR